MKFSINIIIVFMLTTSFVIAANTVAITKKIEGEVNIQRDTKTMMLKVGDNIKQQDVIMTEGNGSVGILFHDGTALSLGENSIISIEKYIFKPAEKKYDFKLDMKKGLASFESGKIGKIAPKAVKFKVPDGIIGIRGTKFFVEVK